MSRFDPVAGTFRNLYVENGLPDNQVLRLAIAPDDHLFVGTYEGLVSLNPEEFQYAPPEPQVVVTRFEIFNSPVVSDTADESTLDSANARQRQFTLTHKDDVIGIEMAVFDYRDPAKNRYAHQLVGIDPDWV